MTQNKNEPPEFDVDYLSAELMMDMEDVFIVHQPSKKLLKIYTCRV